jgi:hypothetical protein
VDSSGIVQFEEGLVSGASDRDFIGSWSYNHLGARYIRQFHLDGSASLVMNGVLQLEASTGSRWRVEDGVLLVRWADHYYEESHVLRDRDTLIFINQPYSNARCLRGDSK